MRLKLFGAPLAFLLLAPTPAAAALDQVDGLRGTAAYDQGLYTAYCPRGREPVAPSQSEPQGGGGWVGQIAEAGTHAEAQAPEEAEAPEAPEAPEPQEGAPEARAASTSEAGWPAKECLKMDKGPAGRTHTLVGLNGVHNWLLGGYGNDTIIGGDRGDVIWADYHPSGEPPMQTAVIRAGNGRNVIYANDTRDYVWTGTNPQTVVHAHVSGISGVIHCQSAGIVVYLSSVSERHFKLDGCRHISHYSVGY